jgi:hypothetical protein
MRHNTRVARVGKKTKGKKGRNRESRKESVLYITFRSDALKMVSFCCCETTWRLSCIHKPRFGFPAEHLLDLMGEEAHCLEDDAGTHTE